MHKNNKNNKINKKIKFFFYKIWSKFLNFFGDIKVFNYPFFFVYDPNDYDIDGENTLNIMRVIQKGDILLRGYRNFLDGKFIPSFPNDKIGKGFSHGAVYVGDNKVIHAVAEGVSEINLIDFVRCDRIAIFRPRKGVRHAIKQAWQFVKDNIPYDFSFSNKKHSPMDPLYCFELCAKCYPKLDIKTKVVKKFGGLYKNNIYVA